jgi:hypothetical protein
MVVCKKEETILDTFQIVLLKNSSVKLLIICTYIDFVYNII